MFAVFLLIHVKRQSSCADKFACINLTPDLGPVLVDVPKDIQQQLYVPDWNEPMSITGYISRLPLPPDELKMHAVVEAIKGSKKPVGGTWVLVQRDGNMVSVVTRTSPMCTT
jgi:acetolactate synthase-1/2/3 large subunit